MVSIAIDRLDGLSSSTAVKGPCRVATTANIALSGEQTIDGVAVVDGDRVLVKNQTDSSQNGVYVADTGAWARAKDFSRNRDVKKGSLVYVHSGTVGAGLYYQATADSVTIDTSSIVFTRVASSDMGFTPAGDIAATTVQTAIEELDDEKLPGTKVETFADLAALNGANLADGGVIWLSGYDTPNDGGEGTWIVDKTNNVGGVFGAQTSLVAGSSYTINGSASGGRISTVPLVGTTGSGGTCDLYFFEGALIDAVITNPGSGYSGTITATIAGHTSVDTGSGASVAFTQNDLGMAVNSADGVAVFRRSTDITDKVLATWFGVKTSNTASVNVTRIQAACDACERENRLTVHFPSARYVGAKYQINSTIYTGFAVGISGDGRATFGSGNDNVSVIEMTAAGNTDIWRPRCIQASGIYRSGFLRFTGIALIFEKAATVGYGWNFVAKGATRTDDTYASNVIGDMLFDDCMCRWSPDGDVSFRRGISAPGLVRGFLSEFSGGYSWDIRIQNTSRVLRFENCGCDGAQAGAFARVDFEASGNVISFENIAAEARSDSPIRGATTGYTYAQPFMIEVVADASSATSNRVYIANSTYSNGYTDAVNTALVAITGTDSTHAPEIVVDQCAANLSTDASYKGLFLNAITSERVKSSFSNASYNRTSRDLTAAGKYLSAGSILPLAVAQNAAGTVAMDSASVTSAVLISDGVASFAIIALKVGSGNFTAIMSQSGTLFEVTTGVLTGTTGTNGKYTVSTHTDGYIYIEQRVTTSRTFKITPLMLV